MQIDPALIFVPEDTTFQNLVLLGNESIVLAPKSLGHITLQTFCGKSYAHSPRTGLKFKYLKQGDSAMIKSLIYAKNNNVDIPITQRAVWTFTNGFCLNTIYSRANPRMSEEFVKYVASVKHNIMPEFFREYKIDNHADRPVCVPTDSRIYVNMHWEIEGYRNMHVYVFKETGEIYKKIDADKVIDKYGYTVSVVFDPNKDPKGIYSVRVFDDAGKIWQEKKVMVGVDPCDMI